MKRKRLVIILLIALVLVGIWLYRNGVFGNTAISSAPNESWLVETVDEQGGADATLPPAEATPQADGARLDEHGAYSDKDDICAYLIAYGRLPENFITKDEARSLGWNGGGLDDYAYGKCIGGDRFGNYEGLLPEKRGRSYTECDVDTLHKRSRGAKRIVFSNDGLIYYSGDHYESFELLHGEP